MASRSAKSVPLPVTSSNITTKFRDAFESYLPNGALWAQTKAAGDVVVIDGNAIAASYLIISKDPLVQGNETSIETQARFYMPVEVAIGAHRSQAVLGQGFSIEMVDDGTPLADVADVAITDLTQATTTVTITTATPHGLAVGKAFGVRGFADSRANYPALVVATTPSPTQITATAGPGGTIPSLTLSSLSGGFIYFRERLGRSREGTSMIFESATATTASFYIRSEAGDALPSGTVTGNHAVTVGSTASVQGVTAAFAYAFQPTTEYKLLMQSDKLQWLDAGVDSTAQSTSRVNRTQVAPSPDAAYKLRVRCTNNKSLTVPVGKIVSATKAASTTATIVFESAHGLTTADQIVIYGIRDQTNFANLTTATAVASVVNATTITIAFGASATATSYGGFVSRVQAGTAQGGAVTQAISTAAVANGQLTLVGNTTWTGAVIGDYVNVYGCRNDTTGTDRGVDGVYRVGNLATTTLTLEPIGDTVLPADFVAANCGGTIIKRTCLRLSFVRVFDYERERIEVVPRPSGDVSAAVPVVLQGGTGPTSQAVAGTAAAGATAAGNPVQIGTQAQTAQPTARTAGQIVNPLYDSVGKAITMLGQIRQLNDTNAPITLTTTTETTLIAAVASTFNDVYSITIANTSATGVRVDFRTVAAGAVVESVWVPATTTIQINPAVPYKQATVNTAWTAQLSAAVTDVRISARSVRNI